MKLIFTTEQRLHY